jgi:hypothetical protein
MNTVISVIGTYGQFGDSLWHMYFLGSHVFNYRQISAVIFLGFYCGHVTAFHQNGFKIL